MKSKIDREIEDLVSVMRLANKMLSRQLQRAVASLSLVRTTTDNLRQGTWVNVNRCVQEVGRYYFIRRMWSHSEEQDADPPCFAKWSHSGWKELVGRLRTTPAGTASVQQWVPVQIWSSVLKGEK